MLQFFRFILGFFSFILLIVLVNVSFFSNLNNNKVDLGFLESASLSGSNIKNINSLDNIYFSNEDSFKINNKDSNIEILLEKGVFILDLNDLTKKYKISGDGFTLDLKSTGDIYIDTTGDKNLIFALDSSFVLNFIDKNKDFVNSYFMYPHEFIRFNPKLTFSYKNVDLYRIRTVTKNGYFNYKLSDILDPEKKGPFTSILGEENTLLFRLYIENKKEILNENTDLYKQINLLKVTSFPFSEYINKYNFYFINDSKKSVFLQNNIYNKLIKLFNEDKFNLNLLNDINNDLVQLKDININKYDNSLNVIKKIYNIIILKHNISNSKKIENFTYLINSKINIPSLENYISLKSIYFNYDFSISNNTIQYFDKFLDGYLKNSGIVEKNENFTLNKKEKLSEIESFVFFLQEYIDNHLFFDGIKNFRSEVSILTKYNNLNKMIYFSGKEDIIKIKTSLNQNEDLLLKLESFLRITFFENYRDETFNVLLLKNLKGQSLDFDILIKFENQIQNIISLFNINKKEVSLNNTKQEEQYKELSILFEEEFLAIKDYESYKSSDNTQLRQLAEYTGIGAKTLKTYTVSDVNKYLSQFNGVDFNANYIIKKDGYFDVSNVLIHNLYYNIKIYPNFGNKIDFFEVGNNKILFSYNLDEIKELWAEKYKGAQKEEKYKYDFSNFFEEKLKKVANNISTNTIEEKCALTGQIPNPEVKDGCMVLEVEDTTITVFKKHTLLEEEFGTIKDYFNINYSNLDVRLYGYKYLIKINNADISINIKDNNIATKYKLKFSSNYDFDNHLFYDISFKIEDERNKGSYLLDGNFINIKNNKVKITELKSYLEKYMKDIIYIKDIYTRLRIEIILNNLLIEDSNGKTYLKFDNNGKNIIIVIEKDNILSIRKNGIDILSSSIKINNINSIINKLN